MFAVAALGIEAEILLPQAKDWSGKPDPRSGERTKYSVRG
jgi:hypothetical protein